MVARLRSWYRRSPKTALALVIGVLCVLALGAVAALAVNPATVTPASTAANATTTYSFGGRTGNGETITNVTFTFPSNADISAVAAGSITISTGSSVTSFSKTGNQISFICAPAIAGKTTFTIDVAGVINPSHPGAYTANALWGATNDSMGYTVTANATAVTAVTASPSPDTASDPAAYTVGFTLGSQGRLAGTTAAGGNTITVTFPADTTVPASASTANVTINGVNPASVATDPVLRTVTLTLAGGQTIPSSSAVTVAFNSSFGLANPTTGGSYTLGVTTSAETGTGTSGAYVITTVTTPELDVTAGLSRPASTAFVTANGVYAVDQIALAASGGDVSVTSIAVRGIDTGGTLASDVSQVRLIVDSNNNGIYDVATDTTVLGSSDFSGGSPTTINISLTVTDATTTNVLVVYTIAASPTNDAVVQSQIQDGDVVVSGPATVNPITTITSQGAHIDTAAPTVDTTSPSNDAVLTGTSSTIQGTASDGSGSGVTGVSVRIQRALDSWYWNGADWQSGEVWVAAAGTTNWTYTWDWTGYTDDHSTTYTITARATDGVALVGTDATPVTGIKIDNVGPTMLSATVLDATHVDVYFSEDLASASIAVGDFAIDNGLSVTAASLDGTDGTLVHLTTSAQTPSTSYTVTSAAGGITDIYGNLNPLTSTTFTGFVPNPTLTVAQGADAGRPSAEIYRTRNDIQAVDELVLSASYGDVTVDQIVVRGLDTAANLTTDVTKVQLFIDDGDGVYDAGDTQLGTDQVFSGAVTGSTATFAGLGHTITQATSEDVWIVYTIGAAAVNDDIVGSQIVFASGDITVGGGQIVSDYGTITSASAGQTVHVDAAAPTVDTSDPVSSQVLTGASKTVAGTVSDGSGSGVASVDIRIQRASDSWYWNGATWQAAEFWNASTTLVGGNWTYDWTFDPAAQQLETSYAITARAADNIGLTVTDATPVTGVQIDNIAPTMSSATAIDATHVDVVFSEDLDGATIAAGDFTIAGLTVSAATLDGTDHTLVHLTTSSQTSGQPYTVQCAGGNVADLYGNTNPLTTAGFTGFVVIQTQVLHPDAVIAGPTNWTADTTVVNDLSTADASYIHHTSRTLAGLVDATTLDPTGNGTNITVDMIVIAKASSIVRQLDVTPFLGGGATLGTTQTMNVPVGGDQTYTFNAITRPGGGAWTWADIIDLGVRVAAPAAGSNGTSLDVNEVYFQISYEPVSGGTLTVAQGLDSPAGPIFVGPGTVAAVDEISLTAASDSVTVSQIVVRGLDTAANLTTDVTKVQLFEDDGDGSYGVGDTQLGTDQVFSGATSGSTATFGGLAYTVSVGSPKNIWIVYTIGAGAVDGDLVGSRVNDLDVTASTGTVLTFTDIISSASGQTLDIDALAPTANTTSPLSDAVLSGNSATISGTADDGAGSGVATVDVRIQRSSDSWYWNGGGWQVGEAWNAATGTTTWDYTWDWTGYTDDHSQTYTITARATDAGSLTGTDATPVTGVKIDNVGPTLVSASASVDKNTVTVLFSEDLDPASIAADGSDFTIAGLSVTGAVLQGDNRTILLTTSDQTPSAAYTVSCAAGNVADAYGNTNPLTTTGFFGYTSGADIEAPTVPSNVAAVAGSDPVIATITWDASTDNIGVTGYNVYRAPVSGGTFTKIGSTALLTFDDESGVPGQEYFYRVSAFDAAANESALSAETGGVTAVWSRLPHNAYSSGTDLCRLCHAPHLAATSAALMRDTGAAAGELSVCFTCHDGSGATTNIKAGATNSFALVSGHSLEDTTTAADLTNTCASCHTPHTDPATSPMLPKATINGNATANDMTWCLACHDDADSWYDGVYPGVSAPTIDATGYPAVGTFPGATAYQDAANNGHSAIATATPTYPAGDCRYCHATHMSSSDYDMLVADFRPSSASTVADDRVNGTYAALCFECHDGTADWVSAGAVDIKRHATYNGADDAAYSGHRIKTTGGNLPVNSPLPCYDCHAPHGSDPADGNSMLLGSYLGTGLDTSTPAGVRQFCFTCHTTSDTVKGWDSATSTYVAVTGETVEGLERDGSDTSILKLPPVDGHNEGDAHNCYTCHGSDYSAAASFNVHNPGPGESAGGTNCFACHQYQAMQSATGFHHYMSSDSAASYPQLADASTMTETDASRTCLMCHVDHDYFVPANADAAHTDGRAQNLRGNIAVAPSMADATTYVDYDYSDDDLADGGVCTSCHKVQMTKNTTGRDTSEDRFTSTVPVTKDYYGTSAHNYFATADDYTADATSTTFSSDGEAFQANCGKCHNDTLTKQFQDGTYKFGLHDSDTVSMQTDVGQAEVTTDPQEQLCYLCHSRNIDAAPNNPNGGDSYSVDAPDVYGGALMMGNMMSDSLNIKGMFSDAAIVSSHPVTGDGTSTSRVECANCHNPHKTESKVFFVPTGTAQDPDNTLFGSITDGIVYYVAPALDTEYATNRDFCLACHDGATPSAINNGTTYVPYDVFIEAGAAASANKSTYVGNSHFNATAAETNAGARTIQLECASCHDKHGSTLPKLLGKSTDPTAAPTVNGSPVTGNNNTICAACHTGATAEYASPTRDASGYLSGTWPGITTYNTAYVAATHTGSAHLTANGGVGTTLPVYTDGDCKVCHDVHGTQYTYDETRMQFESANFTLCFDCHDTDGPAAVNIKVFYPVSVGGTGTGTGHAIKTSAGNLTAGDALPCYDCHNPHGNQNAAYGLTVVTEITAGTTIVIGDAANEIKMSPADQATAVNVRNFCFSCHTTGDTGKGWNGSALVAVDALATFEGINRTTYDSGAGLVLRLPDIGAHREGATTQSCYTCHGNDYSTTGTNVHNPSGGISTGGSDCYTCHGAYQSPMEDDQGAKTGATNGTVYHHVLGAADGSLDGDKAFVGVANYPTSTSDIYCMSCHVDHNLFNLPGRDLAANLRPDLGNAPTAGVNYDWGGASNTGVCTKCHATSLTKSGAAEKAQDGRTATPVIADAGYTTSAHQYAATSTFASDPTPAFSANCSKCHNDEMTKDFQSSAYTFGTHASASQHILSALGGAVGGGLQENHCYRCHSQTTDALAGTKKSTAARDWYDVTAMTAASERVYAQFQLASKHPVVAAGGDSVECESCHNVHVVTNGTTKVTDPDNGYTLYTYTDVTNQPAYCLKCHDGSLPASTINGTTYIPYSVTQADTAANNMSANAARGHWSTSGSISAGERVSCAICHDNHGSQFPKLLGAYDMTDSRNEIAGSILTGNDNGVCYACHSTASTSYPAGEAQREAGTGYLTDGTWPGGATYSGANGIHKTANAGVGSTLPSVYVAGDCKICHDVHGTTNTYDETNLAFDAGDFTLCFDCHDADGTASSNIKTYYSVANGGTGGGTGHEIMTGTGNLTVGEGLPCYDCHNPHGSAATFGLQVRDIGDTAGEIDLSSAAGVRKFCFACHTTSDTTEGWTGSVWTTVSTTTVEGLRRDGSDASVLKLPAVNGHRFADIQSCYQCHGNDYSGLTTNNVHNPSGGVSAGGTDCYACHSAYQDPMEDGIDVDGVKGIGANRALSYHHVLGDATADGDEAFLAGSYPTSTTNVYCMSCHVDHDKFNSSQASNLRPDIATTNPAGAATDFNSGSNSGVCTACHATSLTKQSPGTDQKSDGSSATPLVAAAGFGASAHDYYATSSYGDATSFSANCSKCHNDEQTKDFQTSANKFGTHWTSVRRILSALGGAITDPLQESHCYRCHSRTTDGLAGTKKSVASRDWYDATSMTAASERVWAQFQLASKHPVVAAGGDSVECESCHNAHVVTSGTTKVTDPDNGYNAYTYTDVTNQPAYCLKCHDGGLPSYTVNGTTYIPYSVTQADTAVNNMSTYAARAHWTDGTAAGGSISAAERVSCAICHDNHGSAAPKLLGAYDMTDSRNEISGTQITANDNSVCYACHSAATGTTYTRLANGYPSIGTWPGQATYTGANGIHRGASVIWPSTTYTGGDCKNCHDVHGTAYTYDELVGQFNPSSAANDKYALCFECHDGAPSTRNIKQFFPVNSGGTNAGSNAGHQIKTAGGTLAAGTGLPCYDCHNPHGSSVADGLVVMSMNNNVTTAISVDPNSSAANNRLFCFTCHITNAGQGTNTTASGYVAITGTATVEGLSRIAAFGTNKLRLSTNSAHLVGATTQSCYDCHGSSYASATANNVHNPGAGGSTGGSACNTCHSTHATMTNDTLTFHHVLDSATPFRAPASANTYPTSNVALECVSCHTDHNNFNSSKASNLRQSIDNNSGSSFTNTDFLTTSPYGICVSCHDTAQTKNATGQKVGGSATTPAMSGTAYDASAHDYAINNAALIGFDDGTAFQANCTKCHDDEMDTGSRMSSTKKIGVHKSAESRIITALGVTITVSTEENFCYRCHSTTNNPNAGTGKDGYNVASMSTASLSIQSEFAKTYKHPVAATSGVHKADEGTSSGWNPASSRHVECEDCHNPHAAQAGITAWPTNQSRRGSTPPAIAGSNVGVWGVTISGAAGDGTWTGSGSSGSPTAPTYSRVSSSSYQWQLCLKCHSSWSWTTTAPTVSLNLQNQTGGKQTDVGADFNPMQLSYHPIFKAGLNQPATNLNAAWASSAFRKWIDLDNDSVNDGAAETNNNGLSNTFTDGWVTTSVVVCTDCHNNSDSTGASGPHGSANKWLLSGVDIDVKWTLQDGSVVTNASYAGANFCINCHRRDVYGTNDKAGLDATAALLSRMNHNRMSSSCYNTGTFNSAALTWSSCLHCHGGRKSDASYNNPANTVVQSGAIHGTSMTYSPAAATYTGAANYMGQRFLNGASWTQHLMGKTTTTVGCYNFSKAIPADNYSACVKHVPSEYTELQYSY